MSTTTAAALLRYARELRDRPALSSALAVSLAALWIGTAQLIGVVSS